MGSTWVFEDPLTNPLLIFLAQMALTLALTRILGKLFSYIKQPQVIGEIIGGILMGPTAFGHIPGYYNAIWPTAVQLNPNSTQTYNSVITFGVVANVGLVLFMFMMGLELDQKLMRKNFKQSLPIALSAIIFPFGIGAANALWMYPVNQSLASADFEPDRVAFILFVAASFSFTAFPVLASILAATDLLSSPIGVQAMSCAAIGDVLAWCTLAIASSFAKSGSAVNGVYTLVLASAYVLIMVAVLRPLLKLLHSALQKRGLSENRYYLCFIFLLLVAATYASEVIGIHAFFGAFLTGLIVPKAGNFTEDLVERLALPVTEVFLPLYFVSSGIKTNIGLLNTAQDWGYVLALICIACFAKFTPACLVSKLVTKESWRFCSTMGVLMNTRGLVEVIALNIGVSLGLLSLPMFTMLIIMAIATTVMTSPLVWFLYQRKYNPELERRSTGNMSRQASAALTDTVNECADATTKPNHTGLDQSPRQPPAVHVVQLQTDSPSYKSASNGLQSPW